MSLKASAWAWEAKVKGLQKLVLLAIADYAGRENNSAWPSVSTLAERCGISRMSAIRAIRELQDAKLLEVETRSNRTNLYRLPVGESGGYQSDTGYQRVTTVVSESDHGSTTQLPPQYHSDTLTSKEPVKNQSRTSKVDDDQAKALYDAYPRKAARPNALKAIKSALKREAAKKEHGMSYQALVEKTKLWATACQQKIAADPESVKYIKHAATWFNQQCYHEDTAEWGIEPKRRSQQDRETDAYLKQIERETAADLAAIQNL